MDKCPLFCLEGALCPEWNGHMTWKLQIPERKLRKSNTSCLCWIERNRCCWAIQVKYTITSVPSRRCSVAGWFTALPGRTPQEWHSWWLRQHERFGTGEPLLSKASDLYTGTMCMSRSLAFAQKTHPKQLQNRLDKINRDQRGTQFWSTEGPYLLQRNSLLCIDLNVMSSERVKCLGVSRHAARDQLFSGDGPLLAEVGRELEQGTAKSGPDRDTGRFRCNIPVSKTRRAIPHVVPKGVVRLTMAVDRQVLEKLTQHWKLFPTIPSLPRVTLISEASTWAETTQLLLWKSQRFKLTAAVESCGQSLCKPLQQESGRITCQPPK